MSKSKNTTPATTPTTQKPLTLDEQAVDLHKRIGECEDGAAPLYLKLGLVLEDLRVERKFVWKALIAYAADTLDLRRSRVVRARRIWHLYKDIPEEVNGLTVYEALQHKPKGKPAFRKQGDPLQAWEFQAATRFEAAVGGKERAVEVLTRIAQGEKPVETRGNEKLSDLVKKVTPKKRSVCRKNPQEFFGSMLKDLAADLDEIRLNAAGQATQRALQALMEDSTNIARSYLTVHQAENLGHDPLRFCADLHCQVNEAMGLPSDQPAAAKVPSSN
jgi:hypothetical protein